MTIKLGNLADWRILEAKALCFEAPDYDHDKPRRVRLYLNQEVGCNWYVNFYHNSVAQEMRFLSHVPQGLQVLEFTSPGDFEITPIVPDETEIQYWTSSDEEFWTEGDGETFSTVYERQPRNEAMEYILFQASQNQLRRDKAHAAELEEIRAMVRESNERSGIHGKPPAQYQEREPGSGDDETLGDGELGGSRRRSSSGAGDIGKPGSGSEVPVGAGRQKPADKASESGTSK